MNNFESPEKKLDRQLRELAASAHSSINGFMRVVQDGSKFPIVWCNKQVCKKLGRDPSNIIGADFHICMPEGYDEWHRPIMEKWFANPYNLILDRMGKTKRPFELVDSKGKKIPVAVFIRSRPSYPEGMMFGIEKAPIVEPGAWIEIVFSENMFYYRQYQELMKLILPHLELIGYQLNDTGDNIRSNTGGGAVEVHCPAAIRDDETTTDSRGVEPSCPHGHKAEQGAKRDREPDSEFETDGLDP